MNSLYPSLTYFDNCNDQFHGLDMSTLGMVKVHRKRLLDYVVLLGRICLRLRAHIIDTSLEAARIPTW